MKNQRILFIIHRLYFNNKPKLGGIDRILDFLKENNSVNVIEHPFEKYNHPSSLITGSNTTSRNLVTKPPLLWFEEFITNMLWILTDKKRYDLAIASDPLNYFSCLIAKIIGKAKKTQFHSTDYSPRRFQNFILEFLYQFLYKLSLNNADIVTVISNKMSDLAKKKVLHKNWYKIHLLPNSPYFDDIPKTKNKKIMNDLVMLVGRWGNQIDTNTLIRCLKLLKKTFPNIKLNIIGYTENRYINAFKDRNLSKSVIFHGSLPYKEALKKMSKCYIGITSYSKSDSYVYFADSLKIREYAAAGLPIVCDNVYNTSEEVRLYDAGSVYNNSSEMCKAIQNLIEDKKLYRKKSNNAIIWARKMDKKKLLTNLYDKI